MRSQKRGLDDDFVSPTSGLVGRSRFLVRLHPSGRRGTRAQEAATFFLQNSIGCHIIDGGRIGPDLTKVYERSGDSREVGRSVAATAGSTIRWHAAHTESTAAVDAVGTSTSKTALSRGRCSSWVAPQLEARLSPRERCGCQRGITFSWYLYGPLRAKCRYIRGALLDLWCKAWAIRWNYRGSTAAGSAGQY